MFNRVANRNARATLIHGDSRTEEKLLSLKPILNRHTRSLTLSRHGSPDRNVSVVYLKKPRIREFGGSRTELIRYSILRVRDDGARLALLAR